MFAISHDVYSAVFTSGAIPVNRLANLGFWIAVALLWLIPFVFMVLGSIASQQNDRLEQVAWDLHIAWGVFGQDTYYNVLILALTVAVQACVFATGLLVGLVDLEPVFDTPWHAVLFIPAIYIFGLGVFVPAYVIGGSAGFVNSFLWLVVLYWGAVFGRRFRKSSLDERVH